MKKKMKKKGVIITPEPSSAVTSTSGPTVWLSDNFAEDWFKDALNEARTGNDYNSHRREIIFATCFLESYIFEWTRRVVQIEEINDYFPSKSRFDNDPRYRRELKRKWKEIPRELYENKKIKVDPQLDLSGLGTLLKYRHGLIHAAASRPLTDSQPKETKPFPTKEHLKKLNPGWAVEIAVDLVTQLHKALGSPTPSYLENP